MNNPINLRQDRRQWLKTSAVALGATVLPLPAGTTEATPETQATKGGAATGHTETAAASVSTRFFTPAEHALLEELSETIVPADSHSGGAKAAKVADFIEDTVRQSVDDSQRTFWREGLRLINLMSLHYNGKSFAQSSAEEKIAVLKVLSDHGEMTDVPEVAFFHELKSLTVRGYYTSKIGIHDELGYQGNRILMEYVGCDDPTPPAK